MPRLPKIPKKKDPFDALDVEFKDKIASASTEEINSIIAQVSKDQVALDKAEEDDEDFQEKKAVARDAGAVYRDGKKANKLKTRFCVRVLQDRGKE